MIHRDPFKEGKMKRIGTMFGTIAAVLAVSGLAYGLAADPSASGDSTSTIPEGSSTTISGATSTTIAGTLPSVPPASSPATSVASATTTSTTAAGLTALELQTFDVLNAGRVVLEVGAGAVRLVEATAADGWTISGQEQESGEVEVDFSSDSEIVEFKAEWEDGGLELKVETRTSTLPTTVTSSVVDTEARVYRVGDAGTVTLLAGPPLQLVGVQPHAGWTFSIEDETGREVEVYFLNDGEKYEFEAEWDDGRLEIEIDRSDEDSADGDYDRDDD
jgi:hypothetical protein